MRIVGDVIESGGKVENMTIDTPRDSGESITGDPLVSVVIPVYNVNRYLPQCLESVISQTYRNIEIIIIDDGSTDDSGSICDRYAKRDARIHVIHSNNRGLAAARNLGLEYVKGEYISFIDSDDWIDPHTIETFIRAAVHTKADIVVARHCTELVEKTIHPVKTTEFAHTYHGQDILTAFADGLFYQVAWNKLYCSECFKDIRFPDGKNYEDVFTTWKLMKNLSEDGGSVTVIQDELIHFRARKSSITHTWTFNNTRDCWEAYHTLFEVLPEYQEKFLPGCFISIGHMWMSYCCYSEEEKIKAEKTIREMHDFSKRHFQQVMRGKYSLIMKMACLLSQSRSTPAVLIGFFGGKMRQVIRKKYVLFD